MTQPLTFCGGLASTNAYLVDLNGHLLAIDAPESRFNIATVIGNESTASAGQGNLNAARVFGNTSAANAGPGNGRRAIVIGSNQTKNDPPRDASARRAAASVRSAAQR